jgi:hypothetical protein
VLRAGRHQLARHSTRAELGHLNAAAVLAGFPCGELLIARRAECGNESAVDIVYGFDVIGDVAAAREGGFGRWRGAAAQESHTRTVPSVSRYVKEDRGLTNEVPRGMLIS